MYQLVDEQVLHCIIMYNVASKMSFDNGLDLKTFHAVHGHINPQG